MRSKKILATLSLILLLSSMLYPLLPARNVSSKQIDSIKDGKNTHQKNMFIDLMPFNQNVTIEANRKIEVSPYGFITYNDTIVIYNNESREFNSILVFYNKTTFKYLKDISIKGKYKGMNLELNWVPYIEVGSYIGMAILLKKYVEKGTKFKIHITGYINKLPEFRAEQDKILYKLTLPQKILLPYKVKTFKAVFESLDPDSRVKLDYVEPKNGSLKENRILIFTFQDRLLFNHTKPGRESFVKFYWTSKTPIVMISNFERRIEIRISEEIHIKEFFEISVISPNSNTTPKNTPWRLNRLTIGLPKDAKEIEARDNLGKITVSETVSDIIPDTYTAYRVNLRTPLTSSTSYSFSIDYYLKGSSDWFSVKNNKWNLSLPLTPIINTTFLSVKYVVLIPEGFDIDSELLSNFEKFSYTDWGILGVISYKALIGSFTMITPNDNYRVSIILKPTLTPVINAVIRLFLMILFAFSLFNVVYVYYRKIKERAVLTIPGISVELKENVEKFLKYYEEFVAIEKKLDDFIKSKLTQRKSPKAIRDQLQSLLETNKKYRDRVIGMYNRLMKDPDISRILKELRDLENRISFTRREVISDWSQYLKGSLSKRDLIARADELFGDLRTYKTNRSRLINRIRNIYVTRYLRKA